MNDQHGVNEPASAVFLSFEHDSVAGRDVIRIWGTSSALPADVSVPEWRALCAAIGQQGEGILDITVLGSRVVIPVEG